MRNLRYNCYYVDERGTAQTILGNVDDPTNISIFINKVGDDKYQLNIYTYSIDQLNLNVYVGLGIDSSFSKIRRYLIDS